MRTMHKVIASLVCVSAVCVARADYTLDQSLERLVGEGAITPRAALGLSRYPSQLKQRLGVI